MTTKEFQSITPYIQPLQKQGSFYTFSSAAEDYTTTMSEISDVKFRFSKYALLKIPDLIENYNIVSNSTKLNAIPGVFINQFDGYTKNELFSEVFENYCLNFENGLLSQDTYDNRELKTVAERVFFKFLVDCTAIRFETDFETDGYIEEENSENVYERVVKAIGEISASSVSKNTDSTYTTAYVHVADVNGTSDKVLFNSNFDINYPADGIVLRNDIEQQLNNEIIFGRQYTDEHPFGLDIRAIYDNDDGFTIFPPTPSDAHTFPTIENGFYTFEKKELYDPSVIETTAIAIPNGDEWIGDWNINKVWYGSIPYINTNLNSYHIRKAISYDNPLSNTDYGLYKGNIDDLRDNTQFPETYYDTLVTKFRKTNLDGIEIDWNLSNYGDYESFNDLAQTENSESYDFNAVLLYYDLYEDAKDSKGNVIYETLPSGIRVPKANVLATNLFGIQFLSDVEVDSGIGAKIECFKKIKSNSNLLQSGTEYGLSLNFKISTNTGGVNVTQIPVIAENNTIAMGMYMDLLDKQLKMSDIVSNVESSILGIVNNTTEYLNLQKSATYDYVALSSRVQNLETDLANSKDTALLNSLSELLPLYQQLNENVNAMLSGTISPKLAVDTSLITQGNNIQIRKYPNSSIEISSKANDFSYLGTSIFTQSNFILKTGSVSGNNYFVYERNLTRGNNYIRFQNKDFGNVYECVIPLKFYINCNEVSLDDGQTFIIYFADQLVMTQDSTFEIYITKRNIDDKLVYSTTNTPKEIRIHKNNTRYFVDTF